MLSANKRLLEELQCLNTTQSPLSKQETNRILTQALDRVQAEKCGIADPDDSCLKEEDSKQELESGNSLVLVKPGRKAIRRIAPLCAACFAAGFFLFLLFLNSVNPAAAENLPIVGGIVERVNQQLRFRPKEPEVPPALTPSLPPSAPEPTEPASASSQEAAEALFPTVSADGKLTGEIESLSGEGFTLRLTLAFAPANGELKQYSRLACQNVELKLDGQVRRIRRESDFHLDRQEGGDVWTGETEIDILDYEGFETEELQAELTFSGFTAWDSPEGGRDGKAAGDAITFCLAVAPGAAGSCSVESIAQEDGEILLKQVFVNSGKVLMGLELPDRMEAPVLYLCGEDGSRLAAACERLGPGSGGSGSEWRAIAALPPEAGNQLTILVAGQGGDTLAEFSAALHSGEPSPSVSPSPSGQEEEPDSHAPAESDTSSNQPVSSEQPADSPSPAPEARSPHS